MKRPSSRQGDVVVIAPMTRHQWWNSGDETAHANLSLSRALEFETVLETMFGLARDGKASARRIPNLLQVAVLAPFADGYLPGPAIAVQSIAYRLLAFIGRLFGYRARYNRYGGDRIQGEFVDRREAARVCSSTRRVTVSCGHRATERMPELAMFRSRAVDENSDTRIARNDGPSVELKGFQPLTLLSAIQLTEFSGDHSHAMANERTGWLRTLFVRALR